MKRKMIIGAAAALMFTGLTISQLQKPPECSKEANGVTTTRNSQGQEIPVLCNVKFDERPFSSYSDTELPVEWSPITIFEDGSFRLTAYYLGEDETVKTVTMAACGIPEWGCR